jgi:hypothetical protein
LAFLIASEKGIHVIARNTKLYPQDLVEVKTPLEIAQTLDAAGASDHLPFMPEMVKFCGQRFRISKRVLTICFSGPGSTRGFRADDVVTLEGVRCSGVAHDDCDKACMIFWRETWLRKVEDTEVQSQLDQQAVNLLLAHLKVSTGPNIYYCQASELSSATRPLSRWERFARYLSGLDAGNFNVEQMAQGFGLFLFWRIRRLLFGVYPRGSNKTTPVERLNLQPGEWVEVKALPSIIETLNERGENHGLFFSPEMRLWCGRRCRVKARLDKIIADGTGQMRRLYNTVSLEGSTCGCSYLGFGTDGCSRCEVTYWREIWLRRSDSKITTDADSSTGEKNGAARALTFDSTNGR